MNTKELDRIDRHILNRLQNDNKISNLKLAEQVGLSPPACLRRVNRLRAEGVIIADVSLVAPQVAGHHINIIVEVEMERDHLELAAQFRKAIQDSPEVTQCYAVTGEVDFILVVSVADMQAYDAFTQKVLYKQPNLRKFRSLISLDRVKFETAVKL
ncbi:Lrp/AsnC family transcriptional regulator [Sedimenticola sp.]|uniref:Lrp/AsnC family transcriptional regulator n=1 Tax=Sedimenticola sp. TaxID=1940285 RepID=UPI003D0DE4B0